MCTEVSFVGVKGCVRKLNAVQVRGLDTFFVRVQEGGKERYVFFAAPHIAVSPYHVPGVLCRPGRPGKSSACGALCACLAHLKAEGVAPNVKPGDGKPHFTHRLRFK